MTDGNCRATVWRLHELVSRISCVFDLASPETKQNIQSFKDEENPARSSDPKQASTFLDETPSNSSKFEFSRLWGSCGGCVF